MAKKLEHLFTPAYLDSLCLDPPPGRPVIYDTKCAGLAVRVGTKSLAFLVIKKIKNAGSQSRKRKIGNYMRGRDGGSAMTLPKARERATDFMREMGGGTDPLKEARRHGQATADAQVALKRTMEVVWDEWVAVADRVASPRTVKLRAQVRKWLASTPLFRTPFAALSVKAIDDTYRPIFNAVNAQRVDNDGRLIPREPIPSWLPIKSLGSDTALKLFNYPHTAWTFAAKLAELAVRDPFDAWRIQNEGLIPEPVKRTRSLRFDKNEGGEYVQEVERLRHDENSTLACTADYVMLLLLLGSRRVETMRLRWSDADFDDRVIKFRPENVKNGKLLVLPLEPWAEQILIERKRKNAERGLETGPQDWIFPSRRRSKAQAVEIKGAELENREPATWATGVTHISSTIEILDLLHARVDRWTSLHDIRRTVAGALTLAKDALEETSKSLNHSPARQFAQTKTYVPPHDMIKMLRKLFAKHEKNMRVFAGLLTVEAAEGEKALKPEQQVILEAAMKMLEDAKVSPEQLRRKLEID